MQGRNPNLIPRKSYFTVSPGYIRQMLMQHGLDSHMVEPVTQTLNRVFNKFGADERLNYDVIERFMSRPVFGGGGKAATLVIAADDASDAWKASADYVCDGSHDEVEIQEALDRFANDLDGGLILLSDGTFECGSGLGATTELFFPDQYISMAGQSNYGTTLKGRNGDPLLLRVGGGGSSPYGPFGMIGGTIRDFFLIGDIVLGNIDEAWITRLIIDGAVYNDPDLSNPGDPFALFMHHNIIYDNVEIDGIQYGVALRNGAYLWLDNNYISDGVYASPADGTRIYGLIMQGNNIEGDVTLDQCDYLNALGNFTFGKWTLTDLGTAGAGGVNADSCIIMSNHMGELFIDASHGFIFGPNIINSGYNYVNAPVVINNSSHCALSDFFIYTGGIFPWAGAVIDLTGTCDDVHMHGVTGRLGNAGSGQKADYFIQIGASCNDCKVWGNDGFGTWDTAAVNDLGTGTDLTAANR